MASKKKGRVTPKGTQPRSSARGAAKNNVPGAGRDGRASPGSAPAAPARVTPNKSATFRHRSR